MIIETEHHGYKITYSENKDRWRCWELDCEGKSLSVVKAKIAAVLSASRKIDAAPVFVLDTWGGVRRATITSWISPAFVWIMKDKRRTKEKATGIAFVTPESEAAVREAASLQAQATALREEAQEIINAIPRISPPEGARFEADADE